MGQCPNGRPNTVNSERYRFDFPYSSTHSDKQEFSLSYKKVASSSRKRNLSSSTLRIFVRLCSKCVHDRCNFMWRAFRADFSSYRQLRKTSVNKTQLSKWMLGVVGVFGHEIYSKYFVEISTWKPNGWTFTVQ